MLLDEFGERAGELGFPRLEPVEVGRRQGDPVAVRAQHLSVTHDVLAVGSLALQRGADFDGLDLALEHPREGAADEALQAALEALSQAHVVPPWSVYSAGAPKGALVRAGHRGFYRACPKCPQNGTQRRATVVNAAGQ